MLQGRRLRHHATCPAHRSRSTRPAAEIIQQFPFGPLSGAAANITLLSWLDQVCIGVNIDPAAVPDPEAFHACLARRLRRGHRRGLMERTDVVVVGGGPGRGGRRHHARPGRAATWCSSTRPPSPATRSAATASPPARCALLDALGLDPAAVPSWQPTSTTSSSARPSGHAGPLPAPPRRRAATPPSPGARELDAALRRRGPRPPASRCSRARRARAPTERPDGVRARGRRARRRAAPATRSAPTACGRRCARRSALADPGYRGEWHAFRQYFTDVSARAAARARRLVRARPAARLRLVVPARRRRAPTSGFGILRDGGSCKVAGHEGALAASCWPGPTSARSSAPTPGAESPHRAWPIPARVDRGRAERRAHPVRRRRRRRHRPDDRRGHRPGPAHRRAGPPRRSLAGGPDDPAGAPRRLRARRSHRRPRRRPPHVAELLVRVLPAPQGRPGRGARRRRSPTGPGATSPAGCSRTTPGRSLLTPRPLAPGRCSPGPGAYR